MLMPVHSGWKKKQLSHMPMFQPEEKLVKLNPRNGKEVIRSTITLNDICHQ